MTAEPTPVEFTARYATSVPDLPSAWSAVMGFVDRVGDDPQIEIRPYWRVSEDETATRGGDLRHIGHTPRRAPASTSGRRLGRTAELIDDLAAFLRCTPDEAQRLILRAVAKPPKPEPWCVVRPETIRRCGVLTGVHR